MRATTIIIHNYLRVLQNVPWSQVAFWAEAVLNAIACTKHWEAVEPERHWEMFVQRWITFRDASSGELSAAWFIIERMESIQWNALDWCNALTTLDRARVSRRNAYRVNTIISSAFYLRWLRCWFCQLLDASVLNDEHTRFVIDGEIFDAVWKFNLSTNL